MTSTVVIDAHQALATLRAGVDELLEADLGLPDNDVLLDVLRELEVQRRRLAAADARVVAEIDARSIAHDKGARDTVTLVSLLLRVDPSEAKARFMTAKDTAGHVTLTGERVGPIFPAVAQAMREGEISAAHARIISSTIDALPWDVQASKDREIEAQLLAEATRFAPRDLKLIARRLLFTYDQDGRLADDADRARLRSLDYRRHADGTATGTFRLDPTTAEAFETALDSQLRNMSAEERGHRSPTQLRHDALRDVLLMTLRTGELPATGGVTTTMVVTLTLEQYEKLHMVGALTKDHSSPRQPRAPGDVSTDSGATGSGRTGSGRTGSGATGSGTTADGEAADEAVVTALPITGLVATGHNVLLTLDEIAPLLGDARIFPVALGPMRRVEAYGDKHRIFNENQRLALAARDRGCSFVGCTAVPSRCEAHHVRDAADGGPTSVENGTSS